MTGFEDALARTMFSGNTDKTFVDKLLGKDEVERVRELIKKSNLKRGEILEILYLLVGQESKLVNYSENDRYVILKFFVWIREFVKITETLFDYHDDLELAQKLCSKCNKRFIEETNFKKECVCDKPEPRVLLTERSKKALYNVERNIEHATKWIIDLYLNISRTTLSVGATGFSELLKNKYELQYRQAGLETPTDTKKGWMQKFGG